MGKARDYIPALKYGNLIYPNDLAGMLGLPSVGNVWYVDAGSGSDTANSGTAADDAFLTVGQALSAMSADNDDVLIIASTNSTGRTTETGAINWNKRRTHIVGNGPLRKINPRNGIGFPALGGSVCFTVSATDCSFVNISIASFTDNNVLVDVTAAYNSFDHVHFQGIANDTTGDDTAARSLRITGAGEIIVSNSTIGVDTVTRSTTNASLEVTGSCPRNQFINCDFPMFTDNAGPLFVKAATGNCNERFLIFDGCLFLNAVDGSSTTITVGMDTGATGNGVIFMRDCWMRGATDMCDTYTNVYVTNPTVNTANQTFPIIAAT
jgi:hypothetical protein